MSKKQLEEQIIQNFQQDEQMMILIFAQWCVNHDLNPEELYTRAYPKQKSNSALQHALSLTVSKEEAGPISDQTVLGVLSLFGNDDLAYIVTEEISKRNK
ncbi:hypothetical protein [Alkalihalobacillus sp. BA299]|uniref:hypothetical protein n=1 Tax=Alkalihalobacillus sp. BA299 TaxID=2815938 RepID=UPI001ADCDD90|nr:hypothetical protein [Alkalihalobacillus sp. BA299]